MSLQSGTVTGSSFTEVASGPASMVLKEELRRQAANSDYIPASVTSPGAVWHKNFYINKRLDRQFTRLPNVPEEGGEEWRSRRES